DKLHEECGVFGIIGASDAAAHCALGLHALQHRGQEAAGIVSYDDIHYHQFSAFGKVGDSFNSEEVIKGLPGKTAIGHNRYSTSGKARRAANIQPLFAEVSFGGLALAHNGNLTNARLLKKQLVEEGSIFRTTMDTEVIIHLIALSKGVDAVECLVDALKQVQGAYSMVVLAEGRMIGVRDPLGVRPLVLGRLGSSYVLASETCALDIIGARFERDIQPGELVILDGENPPQSLFPFVRTGQRFCVFEYVYFSRPDSQVEGRAVYEIRKALGRELAKENGIAADIVVPVPDSGVPSAIGYAEAAGLPFELGIIRNHYVGRTFIEPGDQVRHLGVKLKHNANPAVIKGKRVVLVDDSIVRGTTSKKIVQMVRDAGAMEVHMRISSPPTTHSCFYGVDTPSQDQLLAHQMSIEEMRQFIGADSLLFVSVDGMYRATGEASGRNAGAPQYCDACFTGDYAIPVVDNETDGLPLLDSVLVETAS
ncbi:MAG: amidophosphoribosyltransferase, partial [Rickettsiales bacterium]|nr:amidophosphoribosyltransferase [Rickettsiales bacterium]